jgi:hypothetical protein
MSMDDSDHSPRATDPTAPLRSEVKRDIDQVTDQARHDLDAVQQRAAEDVRELRHEAGARIGEATDKAKSFADDQKNLAAGQITGVADAITKVADELDGSDQATVARYARDLASGLSSMGRTIEGKNVDDLLGMAQDFGRKQPVAFLGAAALAGFVASRFALASAQRRETAAAPATTAGTQPSSAYGTASGNTYTSSSSSYGSSQYGQGRTGGQ